MFRKIIFILVLIVASVWAKDIVVYNGSAEYKGQVGGGKYQLANAEYYKGDNGKFMLGLTFDKNLGKIASHEREISITGQILNKRQIIINSDYGDKSFMVEGCKGGNVIVDSFVGQISLNLGVCD